MLVLKNQTSPLLVGGCVRDALLGHVPKDFDIVVPDDTDMLKPCIEEAGYKFKDAGTNFKVLHISKSFHVFDDFKDTNDWVRAKPLSEMQPRFETHEFEIAQFRKDVHPEDNTTIITHGDINDDAHRRDLTINALYLDPFTDKVLDPTGLGQQHVENKVLCFVGDPWQRLCEDFIRSVRFLRFAHKLGFEPDKESLSACKEAVFQMLDHAANKRFNLTKDQVRERVSQELIKAFGKQHPLRLEMHKKLDAFAKNKVGVKEMAQDILRVFNH